MEYKIIRTEAAFVAEKENWIELYKQAKDTTPFQSWEWCYTWWKYREKANPLFIVKAFSGKKIEGYAPLVVKNGTVEFIGGRDMDYGRFLIDTKSNSLKVVKCFLEAIDKEKFEIAFQEMSSGNMQLHAVQKALESHKYYYVKKTTRTSFIPISNYRTIEEYVDTLSGRFRKSLRKVNEGKLQFEKADISETTLAVLEKIFRSRQEYRGGSKDLTWAIPIIKDLGKMGIIEVYFARLDGTPVAYHIVFSDLKKKYIWLIAHDSVADQYRPGRFLRYNILRVCFEQGMQEMNNMRGDYGYKLEWNVDLDTNYTIYVFRSYVKYIQCKFRFWVRPKLKKIVYNSEFLKRMYKKYA